MIVVLDSNIWLSELGLKSALGAALKFFFNANNAKLAIPEVVRLEVEQNLRTTLTNHINDIRSSHSQLLTVFGSLREIILPTEDEVQIKIEEIFDSVDVDKLDVPFSLESARNSFLKTITKSPPSDRSQQFKDGVIWADCLNLLAEDDVTLVSSDKAFYKGQDYNNGLAENLRREANNYKNKLELLSDLKKLLRQLQRPVDIDEECLAMAFFEQCEGANTILTNNGFALGKRQNLAYTLFATENSKQLFLDFEMIFECEDVLGDGRTNAILTVKGDGLYMPFTNEFQDLRHLGGHLKYVMPDGTEQENRAYVAVIGTLVLGHREVHNVTRQNLNGGF